MVPSCVQRELKENILLDVKYVGTRETHVYFAGAGSIDYLVPSVETLNSAQITSR
ncbi:MAG TPA: hypothetical protein VHB50_14900 [Bryobacteraceae bacterium]|nr:hypothetical protein [Bryobacteraceae bacterium]